MTLNLIDIKSEYAKDKDLKQGDVELFMTWVNKQPHLPKINELQAILFLQSCYYSNEAAKTALDTYFTVKALCPEMFGNRNPLTGPMKETIHVSVMTPLPKETPDGSTIFFVKLTDTTPDKYIFVDQCRYFDMISMLHLYQKGTSKGHLIVFDMKGISFPHLAKLGPITMKKLLFYLQDALPVRLKGLHFVNIVPFMDKILALMRPFMKKELMDVLFLHTTVDELFKYVPQDCLPQEYGGSVEAVPILHEKIKGDLRNNTALFEWEETQKVDESKRPGKPKNIGDIFGVEGTFKKLEID
ncbi:alpha-tocopherol transfer protein-like [Zophobas morio]|uniref:alpha-tocopherol transfer protein-like n=1 Tax=Zophobas morio TaxID=2755281 RepID=UPI0030834679